MPIPYTQPNDKDMVYEFGNLALMSDALKTESGQGGLNRALQIVSVLQTTLDCESLIEIFSQEISIMIPHQSMVYEHQTQGIRLEVGTPTKHSCSYQLSAAGQSLGKLTITRSTVFDQQETTLFEHLLCSLVYPLRNALLYKGALTAALRDPLTGANNRAAMNSAISREIELAQRHNTPLSLIALDIDLFKQINDEYGHTAGDCILQAVVERISECTRSSDMLFRYGGEEFTILLSNTGKDGAMLLAERIRRTIYTSSYKYGNELIPTSASLGVACINAEDNATTLFDRADIAMYEAKNAGRNCVKFAGEN
ncbi:MAG: GGDEF domain-containing protein [Thiotrichaceae bacterium]|nr:GGDEF domain-containing protein [Thiotrichaceae bacterium]